MSMHKCPIPACRTQIPGHLLMCRTHWGMVDGITQNAIYDAYRTRPGSSEHFGLVRDAIRQVMALSGKLSP